MVPERSVISNQLTQPKKILLTLANAKTSELALVTCLIKLTTLLLTVFICELTFSIS
jgi:hypothetical protein